MKMRWGFAVIAFMMFYIIPLEAQVCGLYTYQDLWIDAYGNAIAENYTEASCGARSSAYAEAHMQMPSGFQNAASASGTISAEALAHASTSGETGSGLFWGFNETKEDCWDYFNSSVFSWPIDYNLAYTKSKWNSYNQVLPDGKRCFLDSWCTSDTTPPTCNPSYADQLPLIPGMPISCFPYYETTWVATRIRILNWPWKCFPLIPGQNAIGTTTSSLKTCTKL